MRLLAAGLLAVMMAVGPRPTRAADPEPRQAPSSVDELFSITTLVHVTGALLGYAAYSYLVAPLAPPAGAPASTAATLLTGRMAAVGLAGMGAVGAALAWDRWNSRPIDLSYVWVRSGMIAGFGVASVAAGLLGLPTAGATWSAGWFANRLLLTGGALLGGYAIAHEYGVTLSGAPAATADPPAAAADPLAGP